ncbi:MAG: DUF4249 domain-containing protein [Bacteroidota bacterium]
MKNISYIIALFFFFSACNLTQEVEIELPDYDNQIMVESYLVPGQPFTLLLTQSFSYFAPIPTNNEEYIEQLFVPDAEVIIRYDGKEVQLQNELSFNPFTGKLFNYAAGILVPEDFDSEFQLEITTADGEVITASTVIPEIIPIDSVVVQFDERDSLARALTYWTDMPNKTNYYRRLFAEGSRDSLEIDFILDDELTDNGLLLAGTNYDFEVGDTIFNTIYHTTEEYFTFMNSVFNAEAANGNPFAQPSSILSNVEGEENPLGIFTGLTFDERRTIIEK